MLDFEDMTDREIAEETLRHLRMIAAVVDDFARTPMVQAMQGGSSPLAAMMTRR